jgi:hypothetical protein
MTMNGEDSPLSDKANAFEVSDAATNAQDGKDLGEP